MLKLTIRASDGRTDPNYKKASLLIICVIITSFRSNSNFYSYVLLLFISEVLFIFAIIKNNDDNFIKVKLMN